jgi:hypothetical protein
MTRWTVLALILATGAGCRNVAGPLEARGKPKPDAPGYTIEEQQRRARDKYALPSDEPYLDAPGYLNRGGSALGRTGNN